MKLLKQFQDLQNETCEISIDELGNYWIGRRGSVKMNVSFGMLEHLYIKTLLFTMKKKVLK